ncbi:MAG TPA: chemotaxis response regulator protein-glutamate methylesterase [Leptospiraceae bacterium]|nr:chemotaxis response regulator protein-glutamate methylesterase [Leptospiraceae bacterium]
MIQNRRTRGKIKVLVVDDQAIIRNILEKGLNSYENLEVVGKAANVFEARDMIVELDPDVISLDIEMPKMNGLEFLKKLMPQYPLPVVIVSSHTLEGRQITLDALDAGAVDFVTKPDGDSGSLNRMISELSEKLTAAAGTDLSRWKKGNKPDRVRNENRSSLSGRDYSLIAIGASTGGTVALKTILTDLPSDMPGIVVVQHMPEGYTKMFADRLNVYAELEIKEAEDGDLIRSGRVLIAPGDQHMKVVRSGLGYAVSLDRADKVSGHRPSVDVLFRSISELPVCRKTVGIILTGMGRDGAQGLLEMRKRGARTVGQDEESCVVYGMPREAFLLGAVEKQIPLHGISDDLCSLLGAV